MLRTVKFAGSLEMLQKYKKEHPNMCSLTRIYPHLTQQQLEFLGTVESALHKSEGTNWLYAKHPVHQHKT